MKPITGSGDRGLSVEGGSTGSSGGIALSNGEKEKNDQARLGGRAPPQFSGGRI
jgi:hypothetical protein